MYTYTVCNIDDIIFIMIELKYTKMKDIVGDNSDEEEEEKKD